MFRRLPAMFQRSPATAARSTALILCMWIALLCTWIAAPQPAAAAVWNSPAVAACLVTRLAPAVDCNTNGGKSPTIFRACLIQVNELLRGDGAGLLTTGVVRLLDCVFDKNNAESRSGEGGNGGGLAAEPSSSAAPAPIVTLHNVRFVGNQCVAPAVNPLGARAGGGGGGAFTLAVGKRSK